MTNSLTINAALQHIGDNDLKSKIPSTTYYAANVFNNMPMRSLMNILMFAGIVTAAGYSGSKLNFNVPSLSLCNIGVIGGMAILAFEASHYLNKFLVENDDGTIKESYQSLPKRISVRLASAALLTSALAISAYAVSNMRQMSRVSQYIPTPLHFNCRRLPVATAAGVASAAALIGISASLEDKLSKTIIGIVGPDLKSPKEEGPEESRTKLSETGDTTQRAGSVPLQGWDATPQEGASQGAGDSARETNGQA